MKLSVIIPCYNEKGTIKKLLEAVKNSPYENKEIIIIDDASTDGTTDILRKEVEPSGDAVVFYHSKNQGKGAAIRTGIKAAKGDLVIIQDADLEYSPMEYPKLVQPILDGKADIVFGSRFSGGDTHRVVYFWHRVGNGILTLMANMLTNLNLTDMETCYKLFKREIIQNIDIEENRFGFEPEIVSKVAKIKGIRIYEVGISYYGRAYEEGKKIGWKDGFRAIWALIKYNIIERGKK